jgi:hypothetical protein
MPLFFQIPIKIPHSRPVLTHSLSATSVRTEFFYTTGSFNGVDIIGGESVSNDWKSGGRGLSTIGNEFGVCMGEML